MAVSRLVGARVRRKEDPRLITGASTYVDDIRRIDMAHLAFVRSPYAHARIKKVDVSKARAMQGVLDVLVGRDLHEATESLPVAPAPSKDMLRPKHYALAAGKVRQAGEAVAAVIAESRYAARDAAELVEVKYEPLPAVVDPEKAMQKSSPVIHEEYRSNIAYRWEAGDENATKKALQRADRVVRHRFVQQRLIPTAIETRGVVVEPHPDGGFTMWTSTQIPHVLKSSLASILRVPENLVRVVAPEVGGGFGCKLNVYAEEVAVAVAALRLRRPVKWIEDRSEAFVATIHGRGQINEVEAGVMKDGRIVGLRVKIISDLGAYHQLFTPGIATFTGLMMVGPYAIPAAYCEVYGVFTNKTPTDAYRGAGRPEGTYLLERTVDLVAADLGIDPAVVRKRNLLAANRFPYKAPTGLEYDSGNYLPTLERVLDLSDYKGFRKEQAAARRKGRYLGLGLSTYVEICGMGPSKAMGIGCWESGTVRVEKSGKVTVLTGASPHGQGQETTFAQLVAEDLGVPFDDVVVLHGDTAVAPTGVGTFGSRATAVGGAALRIASEKVIAKAKLIASHLLEASPDDLVYQRGGVHVRGAPTRRKSLAEIAMEAYSFQTITHAAGIEPGLEATNYFEPSNFTYPFGAHAAIVEVDVETGEVDIRRYVAVDDCGKVINPMLVEGQIHGGITQGIGQALFEGAVYDDNGQLLSGSLMDYAVPVASRLPLYELARTETPSPVNPLGVKGIGEAGTIAATPAVVNAVVDALGPLGVRDLEMPLSPRRVWDAIQAAKKGGKRR